MLFKELRDINKGEKPIEKKTFLENTGLLIDARKKVLDSLKSNIFPIKNTIPEYFIHLNDENRELRYLNTKYLRLSYMKTL